MYNFTPIYLFAFLVSFLICIPICRAIIPALRKRAAQPIYEGGPVWHTAKCGTPTLGGISFIISISLACLLVCLILFKSGLSDIALSVLSILIFSVANSLVGLIDDLTKLKRKRNKGLSPLQKLIFQLFLAILFLIARHKLLGYGTEIVVADTTLDLGVAYYPLSVFFLLGLINCANLTDGIDGLATGVSATMGVCIFLISAFAFSDAAIISAALAGGALAFMKFNINPAKIFMGDTGSLFLGAVAASVVFCLGNPFLSMLFGGIYVIEGCSVILQVLSFKTRKKRILLMAPLHHHLEKRGWSESKICSVAMLITLSLSIPAYMLI